MDASFGLCNSFSDEPTLTTSESTASMRSEIQGNVKELKEMHFDGICVKRKTVCEICGQTGCRCCTDSCLTHWHDLGYMAFGPVL